MIWVHSTQPEEMNVVSDLPEDYSLLGRNIWISWKCKCPDQ